MRPLLSRNTPDQILPSLGEELLSFLDLTDRAQAGLAQLGLPAASFLQLPFLGDFTLPASEPLAGPQADAPLLPRQVATPAAAPATAPIAAAPVEPSDAGDGPNGLVTNELDADLGATDFVFSGPRPTDASFNGQWHISAANNDINLRSMWADYTGRGVSVSVLDDGFDHLHRDIAPGYLVASDYDWRMNDADARQEGADRHGTAVMGVIGADQNGTDVVGVAHDASLAGLRIGFGSAGNSSQYASALRDAARFDISNNSWGYTTHFADNFNSWAFMSSEASLIHGTSAGRGGLGTTYVFAAGNSRGSGDNVNHHNYQNSIYTMAVAATDSSGRVASFSTPGAALHVSAPGVGILTTDNTGTTGYSGGNTASVSGTSFAAPIVSGVVALMLDANAQLGWRDVEEILAYTARQTDATRSTWKFNQANDSNGGGLHTSTDYGFGLVDAHAAVRLAETWGMRSTSGNMTTATNNATPNLAIPDAGSLSQQLTISQDLRIDHVEVALDLRHTWRGDIRITLVSPEGTESVLINRPGLAPGATGFGSSADNIIFDLTSTQFWSESALGTWTLRVEDLAQSATGTLVSWRLNVFGDGASNDDTYVYTNEFATLGTQASRRLLNDTAGVDSINAAAVTTNSVLDLAGTIQISGHNVTLAAGTVIERAFAGDGADIVRGNSADNWIWGGRGNDTLAGRAGNDVFAFGLSSGADRVEDFSAGDRVWLMDGVRVASLSGSVATLTGGATITAENGHLWQASDFVARDGGWLA
jgi:subtilisin-like proprotein convertase family protein/subtilisin family serine protease